MGSFKSLWTRCLPRRPSSSKQSDDYSSAFASEKAPLSGTSSTTGVAMEGTLPPLRTLSDLIASSISTIEVAYATSQTPFPSLSSAASSPAPAPCALAPEVMGAVQVLMAACNQLIASVDVPNLRMLSTVMSFHTPSAIRLAIEAHVVEALKPAGEKGLHVEEIAKFSNVDPTKLGRCLRLLANQFIFKEVAPDVFANTRLSLTLDTGKDASVLAKEKPSEWFVPGPGIPAFVAHSADDMMKFSAYMTDTLLDPATAKSNSPTETPLQKAFNTENVGFWDWINAPENEYPLARFGIAMQNVANLEAGACVLDKVDIPDGGKLVDVGGGVGTQCLEVAQARKYTCVVQDRPEVIEQAAGFWEGKDKEAIEKGVVRLQPHDFFLENPEKGAAVYLLNHIIHDWPDAEALKILQRVAEAASAESKVVIGSIVMPHVLPPSKARLPVVMQDLFLPAPEPLLPTLGNLSLCNLDLQMLVSCYGIERTPKQWFELVDKAGLQIDLVKPGIPSSYLICSKK